MEIPFLDLSYQINAQKEEIDSAYQRIFEKRRFSSGTEVDLFESEFSEYCEGGEFIACANGTDALELIFRSLEIGTGDEVIVPAFTCWATVEPLLLMGITPVYVDVSAYSLNINKDLVQSVITPNTKAILAVNLFGNAAELEVLKELSIQNGIHLIEDCAQAHGSRLKGNCLGTFGTASAFSFYPTKNLGAFGEAGGVLTNDSELAARLRMMRDHGQSDKDQHIHAGRNSRMDEIQAAWLRIRLRSLDHWNDMRRANANLYNRYLMGVVELLEFQDDSNFHQFPILHNNRDRLRTFLLKNGIETMVHYPYTLPESDNGTVKGFPVAKNASESIISLPIWPGLSVKQIEYIAGCIISFPE